MKCVCLLILLMFVQSNSGGVIVSKINKKLSHAVDFFKNITLERLVHKRKDYTVVESRFGTEETKAEFWINNAQSRISDKLKEVRYKGKAKNIILFLGDGMSIPTVTAARIYKGQKEGRSGEEEVLSFEKFPFVGLSKTYCVDSQVTDSAASATAYLTGVKANYATIGVTAAVQYQNCTTSFDESTHASSIAEWAQNAGMRTGFVTTARVTHASPAPLYAHSADRDWECDSDIANRDRDPRVCQDIASQLIHNTAGSKLNVIFGGGRGKMLPNTEQDETGIDGERSDGENLIKTWKSQKKLADLSHAYVYSREGLMDLSNEDHVLGLFSSSHMDYELDRNSEEQPSLAEMTEKAIKLLSKNSKKGFFLFVEGSRIDMAHHNILPAKSLEETVQLAEAVKVAVSLTDIKDTLIVVTSDHAHTMSISGYPSRGNDILKAAGTASDGMPYLTLSYSNGWYNGTDSDGSRHNVSLDEDLGTKDYVHPGMVSMDSESHGGDDVAIFARGPWAHLLTGVNEQNVIPHVMAYAACIGHGRTACS